MQWIPLQNQACNDYIFQLVKHFHFWFSHQEIPAHVPEYDRVNTTTVPSSNQTMDSSNSTLSNSSRSDATFNSSKFSPCVSFVFSFFDITFSSCCLQLLNTACWNPTLKTWICRFVWLFYSSSQFLLLVCPPNPCECLSFSLQKLNDGSITALEFFKLFNIDFVIHKPRQSVLPGRVGLYYPKRWKQNCHAVIWICFLLCSGSTWHRLLSNGCIKKQTYKSS